MLRSFFPALALEDRIGALVHASAAAVPGLRRRHLSFMLARLALALGAFGCLPVYLAVAGRPGLVPLALCAALLLQLVAVVMLSRTGRLPVAQLVSSTGFAALIAAAAQVTGGMASPLVALVALLPLEAALTRSVRAAVAGLGAALAALAAIVIVPLVAGTAAPLGAAALSSPLVALVLTGAAALIARRFARLDRQSRRAAAAADDRQAMLVEAAGALVVWQDAAGNVAEAAGPVEALLGAGHGALRGRGLFNRIHVGDRPAYLTAIADAARGEKRPPLPVRVHAGPVPGTATADERSSRNARHAPAPRVVWLEMSARRVETEAGIEVVAVLHDITRWQDAAESAATLRQVSQQARESRAALLATVGHELRTPLNAVIGFSDLLASPTGEQLDAHRRREYAQIIRMAGGHLLELVDGLSDVASVEAGAFAVHPAAVEPARLAQACCDLVRLRAEAADIALDQDWADDIEPIVADERACRQIVLNLLANAVKFTPAQGRVTLSLRRSPGELVITVRDTGIGIADKDLAQLGKPFFRGDPPAHGEGNPEGKGEGIRQGSREGTREGSGLGLSVVRALVGLHRGRVCVESAPGAGTIVEVTLPADCRLAAGSARPAAIVALPGMAGNALAAPASAPAIPAAPEPLKRSA